MLSKYYALINCAQGPYKEIFVLTFKVHVSNAVNTIENTNNIKNDEILLSQSFIMLMP